MRIIGGILSIVGGIYALVFGILLATGGVATGIIVLLLGAVAIAGGLCALTRWTYILALIGAICVVVAKFFFAFTAEWGLFVLGISSVILIFRSRRDFGKLRS